MTVQELARRGMSGRAIARTLEVTEGTVRYHLRRQAALFSTERFVAEWRNVVSPFSRLRGLEPAS